MDSWQTQAGFVLPLSPGCSARQSCTGPAAGCPGDAGYGCAVWLVAPSHQSVWGEQRYMVSGQGRCSPTLKGWCQCTAPRAGRGSRRASAGEKQCPAKSECYACPTGLLAPAGSAVCLQCHLFPVPRGLYRCHLLPFVAQAAITTGTFL